MYIYITILISIYLSLLLIKDNKSLLPNSDLNEESRENH